MSNDNNLDRDDEIEPLTDEEIGRLSAQAVNVLRNDREFLAELIEKVNRPPSFEIETRMTGQGIKTKQRVFFSLDIDMAEALGQQLKNSCPRNKALQSMFFQLLNARIIRDPSNFTPATAE